jgi:hypothetical protein
MLKTVSVYKLPLYIIRMSLYGITVLGVVTVLGLSPCFLSAATYERKKTNQESKQKFQILTNGIHTDPVKCRGPHFPSNLSYRELHKEFNKCWHYQHALYSQVLLSF